VTPQSGPTAALTFTAYGTPVPQGSTRAFVVNGRAVTTSANKNLRPWRDTMAAAAREAMDGHPPIDGPVGVFATFTRPRPKSRPKRDLWPDRKPDIDKLARGLLDALSGPVFRDDAQVCGLRVAKRYVGDDLALPEPGVAVEVVADRAHPGHGDRDGDAA
jgi:Holliday junction resolvase RusA-like endonuclease